MILLVNYSYPQSAIKMLANVPENLKNGNEPQTNYNPLQVGNHWEYFNATDNYYLYTTITKDTIVNGYVYYRKIYDFNEDMVTWERNDSASGNSFMLDFEDIDDDGDYEEEFPLDSLHLPTWAVYTSYRYNFRNFSHNLGPRSVVLYDSLWAVVFGDTVITRHVEYLNLFSNDIVADKYGVITLWTEGPASYLSGAIINGQRYGEITVDVKLRDKLPISNYSLNQNYPNPFNPTTTISYSIPTDTHVNIIIYNSIGQQIEVFTNDYQEAGKYKVEFSANSSGKKLSSGIYFYQLATSEISITKKMLLIK